MVVEIQLTALITVEQLKAALETVELALLSNPDETCAIVINALGANDYERAARNWFTNYWAPKFRDRISRIAIASTNSILRMAATTVGMMARFQIRAFSTIEAARLWAVDGKKSPASRRF